MNVASSISYPDVDSAAIKWSEHKPRFQDWQDQHALNLCQNALNVLYDSDKSDAYKRGYSKTIFHTIQNILLTKAQDKKQM